MRRKIAAGALIGISSLALAASLVGIALAWMYNEPLTEKALATLGRVDSELRQTQGALTTFETELTRALQTVNETEQALGQSNPESFLESVQTTLNDELVPELTTAKERLVAARNALNAMRGLLDTLRLIPFIQVPVPDQTLADLIASADALESRIKDVGELTAQASTLLESVAVLGGDLGGTRSMLERFLEEIGAYQIKVAGWRKQTADLSASVPIWLDRASLAITIALFWLGFSQLGLFLHGLSVWQGENPLAVLRRERWDEEKEIG